MLVLSRNVGERIFINGAEIILQVIEIKGDRVKLGFDAPDDVAIDREEVYRLLKKGDSDDRG